MAYNRLAGARRVYGRKSLTFFSPSITNICRFQSTRTHDVVDIDALLQTPSWSVRSLFDSANPSKPTPVISKEKLHHLLRLSALPLPKSEAEEAKMIEDLQAQLRFVQAIQEVDTEDVEPLQSIRDETEEGRRMSTYTIESLAEEFAKEETVGKRGRIRRRKATKVEQKKTESDTGKVEPKWDPLSHAAKTRGPYFVVDTAKD